MEGVQIERDPLQLEDCSALPGGVVLLFGQRCNRNCKSRRSLAEVEGAAGWNDAAGGQLRVRRPVRTDAVVGVDGGERRVVAPVVADKAGRVIGSESADGGAVVGKLLCADGVVRELYAGSDAQFLERVELILDKWLIGVSPELLGELGQRLIGPAVERVARILVTVCPRPLVPDPGT